MLVIKITLAGTVHKGATKHIATYGNWFVASFPGLPRFLFFGLRSVQYTEVEEREKRGRSGNTYHVNDVRWTRGGRRGGGARLALQTQ